MLKKLVSVLGWLVAAPLGAACNKYGDVSDRTFKADFPVTREQTRALIKRPGLDSLGEKWAMVRFADPLRFKRLDETVEASGYEAVTLADLGEAYTGKYAMHATLRKGYTGGPPGSATELFVELDDVRLVETLAPPKAPPGKKGILPGQVVVRMIPEGELARLDDRYLINLPANKTVTIWLEPFPRYYTFNLRVMKDGVAVPTGARDFDTPFQTTSAAIYELQVLPASSSAEQPDSYFFHVTWGDSLDTSGELSRHKIKWREGATKSAGTERR